MLAPEYSKPTLEQVLWNLIASLVRTRARPSLGRLRDIPAEQAEIANAELSSHPQPETGLSCYIGRPPVKSQAVCID